MLVWLKRLKPNQSTLPAALFATLFCGVCLLVIWSPRTNDQAEQARFGKALAQTLADSNAGLLLHAQRIELAVIANMVNRYPEVSGVVFYSANNEIIALSGNTEQGNHFTASATLDDTITGYVSIVLDASAFTPSPRLGAWLLSVLILALTPFLSLGLLQLSARGNRSLPIVSVPETKPPEPQACFCITINLHNQMALSREQRTRAIDDAMTMAQEVCAIYQGIALPVAERGVVMLLDPNSVPGAQAICAAFLTLQLLNQFETDGQFRCFLHIIESPGSPIDLEQLTLHELTGDVDVDTLLTVAALAKAGHVLISEAVYSRLEDTEKVWSRVFYHPLLEDLYGADQAYAISELPDQQAHLINNQASLILGFSDN